MRPGSDKKTAVAWLGLLTVVLAASSGASCGTNKNPSGFDTADDGGDGASSGGDDGSGTSSGLCLSGTCGTSSSGVLSLDGGSGSGPHVTPDAGVNVDNCATGSSLSSTTVSSLEAGGAVDSAMKWLYPYDQTVFPGGLIAPVLQWSAQSGGADGVYLHLKSQLFEYKGCFGKTVPTALSIPTTVWQQAWNQSNGGSDQLEVQVTTIAGGKVSGPITEHWTFALGSLKGIVYYNTYTSPQAMNNGAVMFIKPGAATPTPLLAITGTSPTGPCISCHSLSADGSMIVAQEHFYLSTTGTALYGKGSQSFSLAGGMLPDPTNPVPLASTTTDDWGFSAVYPDGSRLLTGGEPTDSTTTSPAFPCGVGDNPGMIGPKANVMYNTKTGATIPYTGLAVQHAMMPMFSPDGKKIVFNDTDNHMGHSLMVQNFDAATNAFSSPVTIYNDANGMYPAWPFFTPDASKVIFALGSSANFSTIPPASFSPIGPVQASASDVAAADLYVVNMATPGTAVAMNLANGYRNGQSYMPYPGRDEHLNFYPTGSPVAAGGYFWAFFTSRRQYGNVMADSSGTIPDPVFNADTKKIWVTAIAIDSTGDPSHPAFYLPGQEAPSGNIRAFAALAPCTAMGQSCTSGIDCCGGYCVMGKCGMPPTCSSDGDKCTTDTDCCAGTGLRCVGGFCGVIAPQ